MPQPDDCDLGLRRTASAAARGTDILESYTGSLSYPCNLLHLATKSSRPVLEAYNRDLYILLASLCVQDERDVEVPVRELVGTTNSASIATSLEGQRHVSKWFTTEHELFEGQHVFMKRPSCRFIYLCGKHSRAQLRVTGDMLQTILTGYQVMPEYLQLLSTFGSQSDPKNIRFSAFFKQDFSNRPSYPQTLLGSGGRHIQMCYNLRGMTRKTVKAADLADVEWSMRAAAILHQFDLEEGRAVWIVAHGRRDLLERYDSLHEGRWRHMEEEAGEFTLRLQASLESQVMFCQWAAEGWSGYISWLEEMVTDRTILATVAPRDPDLMPIQYSPDDIQAMHIWRDKVGETILALQANVQIMMSLKNMYRDLSRSTATPLRTHSEILAGFVAEVDELVECTKMQIPRAQLLLDTIVDNRELLAQHLHGQGAQKTEDLSTHLHREAILMRIITIVTLIYLPATFVSTLFGTDIIRYQDENGGPPGPGKYSPVAMERWCQIAIPLTILTLLAAALAFRSAQKAILPKGQRMKSRGIADVGKDKLSYLRTVVSRERRSQNFNDVSLESFTGVAPSRT